MLIQPFFSGISQSASSLGKKLIKGANGCYDCGLYRDCQTPRMEATGKGGKGILVLAEAPGKQEDEQGIQLIGKSGQRLRSELSRIGIDLDDDCRKLNAVNCRPPKNRTPTDKEIACCRHRVMQEINEFKPRIILALGNPAMKSLCQHRSKWDYGFPSMGNWQGEIIPDQELGCYIIPTWHPAFIERQNGDVLYNRKWRQDLKNVVRTLHMKPVDKVDYEGMVDLEADSQKASLKLEAIYNELCSRGRDAFIAFDYETTGKKPFVEGHKIVCCSLAWEDDKCISFLATPETWYWLKKILRNPNIGKAAHNLKYEHLWTKVRGYGGGFDVRNWKWDSMLASHILDNRKGKSGLKLQAYLKFGVLGYDDAIEQYIKTSKGVSANTRNKVEEAPVNQLLLYCGMDSLLEYRLAKWQMKEVEKFGLQEACKLFFDGAVALTEAEYNGMIVDLAKVKKQYEELDAQISVIKERLETYDEVKLWRKMAGASFNLNSGPQLSNLLYKELKIASTKQTASGADSVDKSVLEDIELPFVQDLLQIRKLEKNKTTYLRGMEKEAPDGVLHPFYHLHTTVSFRSSSSDLNFQNVPKRDYEAKKLIRDCIYPRPGSCWFEVDFSGVEVRVGACFHKDPNMIKYLTDPHSDMHRDTAMDICLLSEEQVSKYLRQSAKNGFVFPQFYGDWYMGCANNIWHKWFNSPDALLADGETHIKRWLAQNKIRNFDQFTRHLKKVEDQFWLDRFVVYNDWRDSNWDEYQKKGYMVGLTGFRYTAIMDRKQTNNFGIQGSAFHCLLWSFVQASNLIKKERLKTLLVGQIHDAMDGNMYPDEINFLVPELYNIMCHKLCEHFPWIIVPIDVEFEMAPVGRSWHEMKPISRRQNICKCGLEWGYKKKQDDGSVRWDCPVCDYFEVVR